MEFNVKKVNQVNLMKQIQLIQQINQILQIFQMFQMNLKMNKTILMEKTKNKINLIKLKAQSFKKLNISY